MTTRGPDRYSFSDILLTKLSVSLRLGFAVVVACFEAST